MKTLVISKPIYDIILPLVDFPCDGDKFYIENSIKSLSNIGSLCAITLAKYGIDVSFTGMIGEDETGRKVKEIFDNYKVDNKYIETSFTERTQSNYKIYNSKTNKFTTVTEKSIKNVLTKYKYEFIPDVVVMDDGDYAANLAAINNYPNSLLIYIGEKFTKDSLVYCNKCNFVITTINFASEATGITTNLNKPKNVVALFQKFIDLYKANLIIKLNNFDILYCVNDEVRLIKNVNKNIENKDNLYYSVLTYFLINNYDIESSIKFTNKVMLESKNDLDMIQNIPDYSIIKDVIANTKVNNVVESSINIQTNNESDISNEIKEENNDIQTNVETVINNEVNVTEQVNSEKVINSEMNVETNINNEIELEEKENVDILDNNQDQILETPMLNSDQINQEGVNNVEKL